MATPIDSGKGSLNSRNLSTQKSNLIKDLNNLIDYKEIKEKIINNFAVLSKRQNPFSWFTESIPHSLQFALLCLIKTNPGNIDFNNSHQLERALGNALSEIIIEVKTAEKIDLAIINDFECIAAQIRTCSGSNYFKEAVESLKLKTFSNSYFSQYDQKINFSRSLPFKYPLKFQQSSTGDCYLLSTLFTISHFSWGRKKLDNMFTIDNDRCINCKFDLKHDDKLYAEIKENYNKNKTKVNNDGYTFIFDDESKILCVSITPEKATEIKDKQELCNTRDFNIKYLEDIIAKVVLIKKNNSTLAARLYHNNSDRTDTEVLSLLGLKAEVVKMFEYPLDKENHTGIELPCYLSYKTDRVRHAYTLNKNIDNYYLVDPHNTEKKKILNKNDIYINITQGQPQYIYFSLVTNDIGQQLSTNPIYI